MKSIQFKIWHRSSKKNYFMVEMPIKSTFDQLMFTVLGQFSWDSDHQYTINCSYGGTTPRAKLKNSFGFSTSPMMENERSSESKLKAVDWTIIKDIFIIYDFGDNHWFDGQVIICNDSQSNKINIITTLPKTIKQYSY